MASGLYNIFKAEILKKTIDLVNDVVKLALLTSSHSFAASSATNSQWSDISANEISGTGYTAGGKALTSQAVTVDNVGDGGVFDADNVSWTSATFTAAFGVLNNTTADFLLGCYDFGGDQTVTAGTFTVTFASAGIIAIV
ncbi:MAG: hypothetical protein ACPG5L_07500 [Vibrio gallaecicus]